MVFKYFLAITVISIFFVSCNNKGLPDKLQNLPRELVVKNYPNELYAEKDSSTGYYYWRHKTSVSSPNCDAKIIEFGTYNYINGEWKFYTVINKPYGAERFEIWYSKQNADSSWEFCKDALLKKGETYTDVSNYSLKNANLVERDGIWYYIAEKSNGDLIMGYDSFHANSKTKK